MFLSGALAPAQTLEYEGRPIADIQFPNGQPLDPADLARVLPFKKGDPLHAPDVAHAIDGLFTTGHFEDIVVEAEPSPQGVVLRFVTKNTRFVGGVTVLGKIVEAPNRAQVDNATQLSLGTPFHDEDVTQSVNRIDRLLRANGFYESRVTPDVQQGPDAQLMFLTFSVHEGKRAKYETPVITGVTKLPDATIIRATGWRLPVIHWWKHVSSARTRGGVQGVLKQYGKKDRLMAKVDLKKLDYDATRRRVHPNLDIDAGPTVKIKAVEAKVSRRVLKRYVPVFEEGAVDDDLLETGRRNLQDYFQSQGYYDVTVEYRVQPIQNDQETIEYAIARGMRYKLVRVSIAGNHYFDADSIRERMYMQPAAFLILRHGRYSEAFRRKDEQTIKNLYQSNGFRDTKVTSAVEDMPGKTGEISVTVNIDEGAQWLVDSLEIRGASQFKPTDIGSLASSDGQPFSETNIANDRETILTFYYTRGFPKAAFKASWRTVTPGHVDVIYDITEGDREYVRDVLTSGIRTTRSRLVKRVITMKPGDPLSPTEQNNIQKSLYDLGVFANIETAIENPDGDTQHKYVLYHFDEANRYTVTVGFGAQLAQFGTPNTSTLAAPGGTTGFSPQGSLTVSRLNFLGLGHTVTLQGVYSSIEKRGSLTYTQPRFLNVPDQTLTYSLLYDDSKDVRTFAARREEASAQLSKKFSRGLTGIFRASLRQDNVSDIVIPVLLVSQFLESVRLGMLSASFIQDHRDNPANPRHGMYNTASFELSAKAFGSQRSFGRALLRNATYYPIGKDWTLARQTQFGIIMPFAPPAGISAEESVPLPERFYAGGADSLRAFPFNQAGPRDIGAPLVPGGPSSEPTGFPLGGNALFINNIELRFPFIGQNIQGVFFHDMGNVYDKLGDISFRVHQNSLQDFNYMVHDVGFGIRYKTPVGPVRVDLAYSINPPSFVGFSGTPAQILNCNPNKPPSELPGYCASTPQNISHFQFSFSIGQTF
ncbi:MAG TPA: BamA/TamA family outer membrane protein [Bryobacteraceae bacterium]|nr:BamA/TamA family outer membrane protein [Bryobacteraceae bacterium]